MQSVLLVRPRVKDDKVLCKLCQKSLPVTAFDPDKLLKWQKNFHCTRDAVCVTCEAQDNARPILCVACNEEKKTTDFDQDRLNMWKKNKDLARKAQCLKCEALKSARRQHKERYEWKQSSYACRACTRNLPPHKFNTTALQKLDMDDQIYPATCGTCEQTRDGTSSAAPPVKCNLCERTLPR